MVYRIPQITKCITYACSVNVITIYLVLLADIVVKVHLQEVEVLPCAGANNAHNTSDLTH